MAADGFNWKSLIRGTGLYSNTAIGGVALIALDAWLAETQTGNIPGEMISVDKAILGADVWDQVPEFATQVASTEIQETRAAVLMQMMPNLASLQINGRLKNPVTFAAILQKCQKLSQVRLTFADGTGNNEIEGNGDTGLKEGFKALREIVLGGEQRITVRAKRSRLTLVATMFARYDNSNPRTKVLPSRTGLIRNALGGGIVGFAGLAGFPAYTSSGRNTAFLETYGLEPNEPAVKAFAAGAVFGAVSTLAVAMFTKPQRTEKFFCMKINGKTALEWFEEQPPPLSGVDAIYDEIATAVANSPMPNSSPSSPARARSSSPGRKKKK